MLINHKSNLPPTYIYLYLPPLEMIQQKYLYFIVSKQKYFIQSSGTSSNSSKKTVIIVSTVLVAILVITSVIIGVILIRKRYLNYSIISGEKDINIKYSIIYCSNEFLYTI